MAVSVSLANDAVSLPVAYRLYLPESWAQDRRRRRAAGVPDDRRRSSRSGRSRSAQIRALQAEGVPPAPVVADAGYGDTTDVSRGAHRGGLAYVVGVKGETTVWRSGPGAPAAEAVAGRPGPPVDPRAADGAASAGEPQAPGGRTARRRLADGDVARGHARGDALPLCPAPRPARASR